MERVHVFYSHSAVIKVLVAQFTVIYRRVVVLLVEMSEVNDRAHYLIK